MSNIPDKIHPQPTYGQRGIQAINYCVSTGTAPRNIYCSFGYPGSYCVLLNKEDKTTQ